MDSVGIDKSKKEMSAVSVGKNFAYHFLRFRTFMM